MKRILVRSLTGVGTMAAYLVGGPGGLGGASGQLDNSILLRERIASNAGLAGEQEVEGLASNENIVVSVPGNTQVLHCPAGGERGEVARQNGPGRRPRHNAVGSEWNSRATIRAGTPRID